MVIGDIAYRQLVWEWNRQSVLAAADSTLDRMDGTLKEVVASLDQILVNGSTDCSDQSLAFANRMIFLTGPIKDVAIRNKVMSCSAQPNVSLALLISGSESGQGVASAGGSRFRTVSHKNFSGLAVERGTGDSTVTALLNAGQFLTDAYSLQLPEDAQVTVRLSDGAVVARSTVRPAEAGAVPRMVRFEAASQVFPVALVIDVPARSLAAWRSKPSMAVEALGALAALAMSGLIVFLVLDPDRPDRRVRRALARREIKPFLQPIFDISSARITGYEVLARWALPDGRVLGPAAFIDEVEKHGLSDRLFQTLCLQTGDAISDLVLADPDIRIAFNVTPSQVESSVFVETIRNAISRSGLPLTSVTLEVTEREQITATEQVRHNLEWLREHGIHIALDDAGTGHNGLSVIAALAPDVVKIDKYFVDGLQANERAGAVISMLVQAAHEMGMKTVAEGVETVEQLHRLRRYRVDGIQGFYMARPMPLRQVKPFHAEHQARLLRAMSFAARDPQVVTNELAADCAGVEPGETLAASA